jgi:hypothetical protein
MYSLLRAMRIICIFRCPAPALQDQRGNPAHKPSFGAQPTEWTSPPPSFDGRLRAADTRIGRDGTRIEPLTGQRRRVTHALPRLTWGPERWR